jgi:hypothetical protein
VPQLTREIRVAPPGLNRTGERALDLEFGSGEHENDDRGLVVCLDPSGEFRRKHCDSGGDNRLPIRDSIRRVLIYS